MNFSLGWLGGSGSLGYFEVKGRVLTVMRLTSRLSLFRENWALSIRSLSLLVSSLPVYLNQPEETRFDLHLKINNCYLLSTRSFFLFLYCEKLFSFMIFVCIYEF